LAVLGFKLPTSELALQTLDVIFHSFYLRKSGNNDSEVWSLKSEDTSRFSYKHAHKIFNNTCPSYLNNNFIKINEYHKCNKRSSRYTYVTFKIKGIESTTFYYNANAALELTTWFDQIHRKCLRKKLNITWNVPVWNWKDVSFHINRNYFKRFIILSW
jgi:hypothetical protein